MGGLFHWRGPTGAALASELQKLESRAKAACGASGKPYSRAIIATKSGVSKETLGAWLDGRRVPQDGSKLLKVAAVLADLSGDNAPDESHWQALWVTARKNPGDRQKTEPHRRANLSKLALWLVAAIAGATIAGVFTPVGGDLVSWVGSWVTGPVKPSASAQPKDVLQASAAWCCRFTLTEASGGFYWPGSVGSLDAHLNPAKGVAALSGLTPAGVGVIEIPLQTDRRDPIYVAPPRVIMRTRAQDPTGGIVAVMPLSGQGGGEPGEFEADVDSPKPCAVPKLACGC
jgi:hypothetical protein